MPTYDFFARNFAVCDHWFAALPGRDPAQPADGHGRQQRHPRQRQILLPDQHLVYDWLTDKKVSWCAYQWGDFFPFFGLRPDCLPEIATSLALSAPRRARPLPPLLRFREQWLARPAPCRT